MSLFRVTGTALAAAALGSAGALAQAVAPNQPVPSHYAITNVRIVAAPGRTIARGTIVIRDGLVAAVGPTVTTPAGAWVIDGAGLTVYPGLIDALSTVGLPASLRIPEPRPAGQSGQGGQTGQQAAQPPHSWGPQDRPAT